MKRYPRVLTEYETLDQALRGRNISRFGDGELRLCLGGQAKSQVRNTKLATELRNILRTDDKRVLPCIPRLAEHSPKLKNWREYAGPKWTRLYRPSLYGSSLMTRPDSAPWIDVPNYWESVQNLWRGQDATLVIGNRKSLREEYLEGEALSLRTIYGPDVDAYAEIDVIEEKIGKPPGVVLLCLGATATVLAARLAKKDVHAVDLGHIGMFMRRRGAFAHRPEDLISPEYREQLREVLRDRKNWKAGHTHIDHVMDFADALDADSLLDYGCGQGTLRMAMGDRAPDISVWEYDPGIPGKHHLPKPADLVVCTDVMEHVEEGKVKAVLGHIRQCTEKGAFFSISCSPSKVSLPDGRNSHITIKPPEWWIEEVSKVPGWKIVRTKKRKGIWIWVERSQ